LGAEDVFVDGPVGWEIPESGMGVELVRGGNSSFK